MYRNFKKENPINLILLDSSEYNLYMINNELINANKKNINIVPILDNINNKVDEIFNKYNVNTIYHALLTNISLWLKKTIFLVHILIF